MEDFPKNILTNISVYLTKTERVLYAVALTAPSKSWENSDGMRTPSIASQIIISGPYYKQNKLYDEKWVDLELDSDYYSSFPRHHKLNDGDICGILVCTDAIHNLEHLSLPFCTNVIGHGLNLLRGSSVLTDIDLSLVRRNGTTELNNRIRLSERAVLPILSSIIENGTNSLQHLRLPKIWRDIQSITLTNFLYNYNTILNQANIGCDGCTGGICRGTDEQSWFAIEGTRYGLQNFTCFTCTNHYCHECEDEGLKFCVECESKNCPSCGDMFTCKVCNKSRCEECEGSWRCTVCDECICEACFDENAYFCDFCDKLICKDCIPKVECNGCCITFCLKCCEKEDDLFRCTHCGAGCCRECTSMEHCFIADAAVCPDCHPAQHDITDCCWAAFPAELKQLVSTFTFIDLDETKLVLFLKQAVELVFEGSNSKNFDISSYGNNKKREAASHVLAAHYLAEGKVSEAAGMLYIGSMMKEER